MSYSDRLLAIQPDHLLAYWSGTEASGTVADDLSDNEHDGIYHNVTLGEAGIGDGSTSALYDGTTSYLDIYSEALAAAWNGGEVSIVLWFKVLNAAVWASTARRLLTIQIDTGNRILIQKNATTGLSVFYNAGGVSKTVAKTDIITNTDWVCVILTASNSANEMKVYVDGLQQDETKTGLGTWAGVLSPTVTTIGSNSTIPVSVFSGWIAHTAVWDTPLTEEEVAELSSVFGTVTTLAERTYRIPYQNRTYVIPAQNRTLIA